MNSCNSDNKVSSDSHTKYSTLTHSEKDLRLKNLRQSLKVTKMQLKHMEAKAEKIVERDAIDLLPRDTEDVSAMFNELNQSVQDDFPEDSPQRVFWNQQKKYHSLKDKRQIRWHPLVIRFALNLKYLSTSGYRAVRQSGLISLPSERTLSDYTHWTKPNSGVQLEFVEELKNRLETEVPSKNYHCAISVDEMKIKSSLVFDKHNGCLVGFVDLSGVNQDIEKLMNHNDEESRKLADQVLVFMARAVFKPTLALPIAHYFSANLTGIL